MHASPLLHRAHAHLALCPVCGADSIRILTSIEVLVDVMVSADAEELRVVDELHGDAAWDVDSVALCPACDWHGTVADLSQRTLTELDAP